MVIDNTEDPEKQRQLQNLENSLAEEVNQQQLYTPTSNANIVEMNNLHLSRAQRSIQSTFGATPHGKDRLITGSGMKTMTVSASKGYKASQFQLGGDPDNPDNSSATDLIGKRRHSETNLNAHNADLFPQ